MEFKDLLNKSKSDKHILESNGPLDHLVPLDTTIKYVIAKNGGVKYFKGSQRAERFIPFSVAKFKKLDLSKFEVYQEINGQFFKIN